VRQIPYREVNTKSAQLHCDPRGAIAQLGERLDRTQEVAGSSPASSIPAEIPSVSGFLGSGGFVGTAVRGSFAERYPQYHPQNLGQDSRPSPSAISRVESPRGLSRVICAIRSPRV
jgi:hypothetical protein